MNVRTLTIWCVVLGMLVMADPLWAQDREVIVTIENLAPKDGVFFTPVWVGFHNGSFNLFDPGALASESVERVAEDGDSSVLRAEFAASSGLLGGIDGVVTAPEGIPDAPVFDVGDKSTARFALAPKENRSFQQSH